MANKNVIIIILVFICFKISSCKTKLSDRTDDFFITSIDSINNVYIIHAKNKNVWYKIVSEKVYKESKCNNIRVGNSYRFDLTSLFLDREKIRTRIDGIY